ncbi:hypothetical protein N7539_003223 [Penicillium diatomitis]|uniref:Transcription factor domain-containing protein n=1 Tax=Penicillium diatomitis TaxID=2819901 RepID=A0A9W9XGE7_9EURO|nr:uncharacterized protein N7539_003223 [Penicillium diatomitis]KAJ5491656.1 hypothetical protein N7539_003223 [Penicillium diatomitis]
MTDANGSKEPTGTGTGTGAGAGAGADSGRRKFTLSATAKNLVSVVLAHISELKGAGRLICALLQMECVKRNIGHLCTKDERQARAKRSKTDNKDKTAIKNETPSVEDEGEAEAEETMQLLEHFVDGPPRASASLPALVGPTSLSVAPDFPNRHWENNDPKRQGEKLTLIQEIVDAMPELETMHALFEIFVTRCQGPLGNVVHTPSFMKQVEQFSKCLHLASSDSRVLAISSTVTMESLGCFLLALVLGLAFHPTPSMLGWTPTPSAMRVEELRASDMRSQAWRSLSLRCLQDGISLFCGSITGLQAAIMLLLDGQEGSLALDAVLVTAISGARKLGLHRLGDIKLDASASHSPLMGNGSSEPAEPSYLRTEVGIRIWWALVMRDWSRGQALGYYTVRPSQFNTRMPLHINDDDLCLSTWRLSVNGEIAERPRSEFTMMSYTVHALELGSIVRESIDLWGLQSQQPGGNAESAKLRKHLNNKYEKYVAGLPSYFRLGSTIGLTATGPSAAIPVQRWMLHQQLWSFLLRLHRATLLSPIGRASCQLLAQNIIGTQAQIQARCAVCGSLSTSETQLFNAAVVLLLDLIFTSEQEATDSATAHLSRLMTRDKVREAIELLRTKSMADQTSLHDLHSEQVQGSAQRSVDALEALMRLSEDISAHPEINKPGSAAGTLQGEPPLTAHASLRSKVAEILRGLSPSGRSDSMAADPLMQENHAPFDPFPMFDVSPAFAHIGGPDGAFPYDLDVLPILSNGFSSNFYEPFDFLPLPFDSQPPKELPFANLGDLTIASGTRMTYTSPSSMRSDTFGLGGESDTATTPSSVDAYVAAKFCHALGDGSLPNL